MPEEKEVKLEWNAAVLDFKRMDTFMMAASGITMQLRNRATVVENPSIVMNACDAINEVYRFMRGKLERHQNTIPKYKLLLEQYDTMMKELWNMADKETVRNINKKKRGKINKLRCSNELFYKINDAYNAMMTLRAILGYDARVEIKKDVKSQLEDMEEQEWTPSNP